MSTTNTSSTVDGKDAPAATNASPRFHLTTAQLEALLDPKDVDKLLEYGGTAGLLDALDTHAELGLFVNGSEPEVSRRNPHQAPATPLAAGGSGSAAASKDKSSAGHLRQDVLEQLDAQFPERVAQYGKNVLPKVQIKSFWRLAWEALQEKILILLTVAAVVSLALGIYEDVTGDDPNEPKVNWVEGFAIIVAIMIVVLAGSLNDYQKERQFQKLNAKKEDRQVKVIRNGGAVFISVYAVQVGDMMELEPGDILCADAVLVRNTNGMRCDESSVTGESDPIRKHALVPIASASPSADASLDANQRNSVDDSDPLLALPAATPAYEVQEDTDPFLISGSKVLEGVGRGVVIAVGENSFYGKTMLSLRSESEGTPLQVKLNHLAGLIAKFGFAAAVAMLIALLIRYFVNFGRGEVSRRAAQVVDAIVQIIITTVTIVVVAVPEGLPLAVTLALAFATTRMVDDHCLVRVLAACETMGSATTICSDKTGTLTQNRMTVVAGTIGDAYRFAQEMGTGHLDLEVESKKSRSRTKRTPRSYRRVTDWVRDHRRHHPVSSNAVEFDAVSAMTGDKDALTPDVKIVITEVDADQAPTGIESPTSPDGDEPLLSSAAASPRPSDVSRDGSAMSVQSSAYSSATSLSMECDAVLNMATVSQHLPGKVMVLVHEAIAINSTAFEGVESPRPSLDDPSGRPSPTATSPSWLAKWRQRLLPRKRHQPIKDSVGTDTHLLGISGEKSHDAAASPSAGDSNNVFMGSKTEAALLQWSKNCQAPDYQSIRDSVEVVQMWPFNSASKRMSTLVKYVRKADDGCGPTEVFYRLYVKGAPEIILHHCSHVLHGAGYSRTMGSVTPRRTNSAMTDTTSVPPSPTASYSRSPDPMMTLTVPSGASSPDDTEDVQAPFLSVPSSTPGFDLDARTSPLTQATAFSPRSDTMSHPFIQVDDTIAESNSAGHPSPTEEMTLSVPASGTATLGPPRIQTEDLLSVHSAYRNGQQPRTPSASFTSSASERSFVFPAYQSGLPVVPMDADLSQALHQQVASYSSKSLRTIALAFREFATYDEALFEAEQDNAIVEQLTWLGVFGIEDPLRPGVIESVAMCKKAGMMVRMVTGDNVLTARSIATQCGIYTPNGGGLILEGPEFRKLSDDEKSVIVPRLQVLARSSPEDKKTLVAWLKQTGEVVAVTGDGTNDGPALKTADIGFSMGIAGTEVAKEASSIILMDDNFASIVKAAMWGRCVNDAVRKFLQFQLTVNVTAVLLAFISAVADDEQASVLTAVQLLWVNLIMDTLAALALATDPPTVALLNRPPEKRNGPLVNYDMWRMILGQSVLQVAVCLVLYFKGPAIFGYDNSDPLQRLQMRTLVFNTFVFLQIFNEFNARILGRKFNVFAGVLRNWYFTSIFVLIVFLQVIIVEFGDVAFRTTHQSWDLWLTAIIIGFLSLPMAVLVKLVPDWWFGWLPKSLSDIYFYRPELDWKNPVDQVHHQITVHPMFKDRSPASLSAAEPKPGLGDHEATTMVPVDQPKAATAVTTLQTNRDSAKLGVSGGSEKSPTPSYRRNKSSVGLTTAAMMVPALSLSSIGVTSTPSSRPHSPFKDDIYKSPPPPPN
ncbi:plasma membrane calcium [Dimargaris verticillata]|uniref:Calcium-transporting ATPase n=1 Tax=Dimargaris verticillata TaxID=2761393 RepID=A0A9W8B3F5_9FUNG|nr:plasma membrane calcium [Dimargaris verticillata]